MKVDDDPRMQHGAAVAVEQVCVQFIDPQGREFNALRDVSFRVPPGECVTVVGPSGCGKTTLLMVIAGLHTATSGKITVNDVVVTKPSSTMGVAFQRDCLLEWRTVLGNVLAQSDLRGWKRGSHVERARELLQMVGLGDVERHHPKALSGGMRQRVSLCRALLHNPQMLLLDEPFGAVDAMTREQLNLDVGRLCAESGVTTLLVTHDINEAAFMGDRVIVMATRPGRVAGIVPIKVPTPRDASFRKDEAFLESTTAIRDLLECA